MKKFISILILAIALPILALGQSFNFVQLGGVNINRSDLLQEIDVISVYQRYPIGTRLQIGQRVFYYARMGDVDSHMPNNFRAGLLASAECVTNRYLTTTISGTGHGATAGAYTVTIDMATHVDNDAAATAVYQNDYQNGWFAINDASSGCMWGCQILKNTAEDATTNHVTLTLELPIPMTIVTGDAISVCESAYWKVNGYLSGGGSYTGYVGMPLFNQGSKSGANSITDDDWIWLQTWGPYYTPIMGRGYGIVAKERTVFGHSDGTLTMDTEATDWDQEIGYFLNSNYNGTTYYDFDEATTQIKPLIFLTISF